MIETQALLQPGYTVVPEELARLREEQQSLLDGTIEALSRARLFELNSGFHETVVGWSGNPFFFDLAAADQPPAPADRVPRHRGPQPARPAMPRASRAARPARTRRHPARRRFPARAYRPCADGEGTRGSAADGIGPPSNNCLPVPRRIPGPSPGTILVVRRAPSLIGFPNWTPALRRGTTLRRCEMLSIGD